MTTDDDQDGASAPEARLVAREAAALRDAPLASSDLDAPTTGRVDDAGAVRGAAGDASLGEDSAATADPSSDDDDPLQRT